MKMLSDCLLLWIFKWSKRFWQNSVSFYVELRSLSEKNKILTRPLYLPSNKLPPNKWTKKSKKQCPGHFLPRGTAPFCNSSISLKKPSWWEKAQHGSIIIVLHSQLSRMTKPGAKDSNYPHSSLFVHVHLVTGCGNPGYW